MAVVGQTLQTLIAHRLMTNGTGDANVFYEGPEIDVSTKVRGVVHLNHAYIEEIANDPAQYYVLQGRASVASGLDDEWKDIWPFPAGTAQPNAINVAATEEPGQTVITTGDAVTAGFAIGDKVYITDNTATDDGEWTRIANLTTSSITISGGLENQKLATVDNFYSGAEMFVGAVDLSGFHWLRMLVHNPDTSGSDSHFEAVLKAFASFA